jgi:hypothetical protein
VTITWAAPTAWNDDCTSGCSRGFRVLRDGVAIASGGCAAPLAATATSCTDTTAVAGTAYTYAVEAFNHEGQASTGAKTLSATDRTNDGVAPTITAGPTVSTTTTTSFTVTWTTDEPSDSRLEYGTTTSYGSTAYVAGVRHGALRHGDGPRAGTDVPLPRRLDGRLRERAGVVFRHGTVTTAAVSLARRRRLQLVQANST